MNWVKISHPNSCKHFWTDGFAYMLHLSRHSKAFMKSDTPATHLNHGRTQRVMSWVSAVCLAAVSSSDCSWITWILWPLAPSWNLAKFRWTFQHLQNFMIYTILGQALCREGTTRRCSSLRQSMMGAEYSINWCLIWKFIVQKTLVDC